MKLSFIVHYFSLHFLQKIYEITNTKSVFHSAHLFFSVPPKTRNRALPRFRITCPALSQHHSTFPTTCWALATIHYFAVSDRPTNHAGLGPSGENFPSFLSLSLSLSQSGNRPLSELHGDRDVLMLVFALWADSPVRVHHITSVVTLGRKRGPGQLLTTFPNIFILARCQREHYRHAKSVEKK